MERDLLERTKLPKVTVTDPYYLFYYFFIKDLKHAINSYAKGRLLDVGCGNKPYSRFIQEKVSQHIGCDIAQSDLQKVDIICPATDLDFEDESFDTILSTQVLEHIEEPDLAIKEMYRVLKKSGYIILSTNQYWPLHEEPYDFYRFTKYGLAYLFKKNGFSIVDIVPNGGMWAMHGQSLLVNIYKSMALSKKFLPKILFIFFRLFGIKILINLWYRFLDDRNKNYASTNNYVIIATKN